MDTNRKQRDLSTGGARRPAWIKPRIFVVLMLLMIIMVGVLPSGTSAQGDQPPPEPTPEVVQPTAGPDLTVQPAEGQGGQPTAEPTPEVVQPAEGQGGQPTAGPDMTFQPAEGQGGQPADPRGDPEQQPGQGKEQGQAPISADGMQLSASADTTNKACDDFRIQLLPILEEASVNIPDEGWAWVDPQRPFRSVSGSVSRSEIPSNDTYANHDSHDQNTDILVDPGQEGLLSWVNKNNPIDPRPVDTLEMEWEIGGHNAGGSLEPQSTFPMWAWPSIGDRVWAEGNWVVDCGHPVESSGKTYYRTEIHPARAIAAMRDQARVMPGTGQNVVPVTATDLYIHGNGGYITDVLNCGMSIMLSDNPNSCPVKRNPVDVDFEFDIYLPPKPFSRAMLTTFVELGPGNTIAIEPILEPRNPAILINGYDSSTVVHVKIPLAGSGVTPDQVYARKIYAGWIHPAEGMRQLRLTLNRMDLHQDKDPDPGDCECTYFWMNVNRASANEWIRLAEYADGNMASYDDDFGAGDGYMTFSDAVFDFYVRPGQSYTVRANGYDQDCLDWFFGDHSLSSLPYIFCYTASGAALEYGDNDQFAKLERTFTASDYGLGSQDVTANREYELEFKVEEIAMPTPSANVGVYQSCTPASLLAGGKFACTIYARNTGPGLPRDLVVSGSLTTSLPSSSYTMSIPTFSYVGMASTPFSCSKSGSSFSCNLVTIPVRGAAIIRYEVTARQAGSFTSNLAITSGTPDWSMSNNQDADMVSVVQGVSIDIQPYTSPNTVNVNPGPGAWLGVAILSSASFNAPARVDPASLTFGRAGGEQSLYSPTPSLGDLNGDGLTDLLMYFKNYPALFICGDTEGILRGRTFDSLLVEGRDSVVPTPCN